MQEEIISFGIGAAVGWFLRPMFSSLMPSPGPSAGAGGGASSDASSASSTVVNGGMTRSMARNTVQNMAASGEIDQATTDAALDLIDNPDVRNEVAVEFAAGHSSRPSAPHPVPLPIRVPIPDGPGASAAWTPSGPLPGPMPPECLTDADCKAFGPFFACIDGRCVDQGPPPDPPDDPFPADVPPFDYPTANVGGHEGLSPEQGGFVEGGSWEPAWWEDNVARPNGTMIDNRPSSSFNPYSSPASVRTSIPGSDDLISME